MLAVSKGVSASDKVFVNRNRFTMTMDDTNFATPNFVILDFFIFFYIFRIIAGVVELADTYV